MKKPYYFDAPLPLIVVKTVALLGVVVSAVLSVVLRNLHLGALNFFFIAVFFVPQGIQDKIRTDKATALIISVFGGALFTALAIALAIALALQGNGR